jgi:hypothetical protein
LVTNPLTQLHPPFGDQDRSKVFLKGVRGLLRMQPAQPASKIDGEIQAAKYGRHFMFISGCLWE